MQWLASFLTSTGWIIVIIFGGAAVVLGNIGFRIQNAAETSAYQSELLAIRAREILHPELLVNHKLSTDMISALEKDQLPYRRFSTGGWEVASRGNMVQALPSNELRSTTEAYEAILDATALQSRLLELSTGTASALSGASGHRAVIISNLKAELQRAQEIIQAMMEAPAEEIE